MAADGETNHVTANKVTASQAVDYHPGLKDVASGPASRVDSVLRRAERLVRDLAPPPDPLDEEYKPAAADAELAVFEFLFSNPAHLESDQLSDARSTYRRLESVEQIVRQAMGRYYVGPREIPPNADPPRPGARLTNVSDEPLW
jgi:hypothetical protein